MGLIRVLGEESGGRRSGPYSAADSLSDLRHVKSLIWSLSFLAYKMRSMKLPHLPHEVMRLKRQCERSLLLPKAMNKGSSTVFYCNVTSS